MEKKQKREFNCLYCGKTFTGNVANREYKYCSQSCSKLGQRTSILRNCEYCKKEFYAKPSKVKNGNGRFCSKDCFHKYQMSTQITVICKTCNKEFSVWPSTIKFGGGIFCSKDCSYIDKIRPVDETIQNRRLRLRAEFFEWRKSVYERDNWTCQKCGKRGGKLNAHHIIAVSADPSLVYDISNGITLCQKCHKLEHLQISDKNNLQIDIFTPKRKYSNARIKQ